MTKSEKILTGFLILVVACWILSLKYCNKPCPECPECPETGDTLSIKIDSIYADTSEFTFISSPIPKPVYVKPKTKPCDPIIIDRIENFDETPVYLVHYKDTVKDGTVDIFYDVGLYGWMDNIKIGYRLMQPLVLNKVVIAEVVISEKDKRSPMSFYVGLSAGGNKDSFNHFKPEITVITDRANYSIGYNVPDNSIIAGFGIRLFTLRRGK